MKKVVWISLASFLLGILAAGYVFVYMPEKKASQRSFLDNTAAPLGSALFADAPQAVKPDLDFVKISDKVGPAVFKVECDKIERQSSMGFPEGPSDEFWDRFFGSPRMRPQAQKVTVQGTGFFISADGYAITNNHIVENGQKVKVFTAQGEEYQAKIIGTDPRTDVALIKIDAKNLPFAELGDSAQVKVGEWVLAIGNPLGMEHTVTGGIVSAKGRQLGLGDGSSYEDFIQTDAAINRGNSGGPLVNMKGEVIGINSNILTPTGGNIGIGFAIPVNMAKKVVTQLKDKGKVVRGWLGVEVAPLPIDQDTQSLLNLKSKKGALINNVTQGGPAEKAGFKPYDVVVEISGQAIENSNDLRMKIADIQPGTKVEFKVIRDGKEKALPATIAELEDNQPKAGSVSQGKDIGLTITPLTANLARRYGIRTTKGLLITDVDGESDAARKGLQPGDIILEVNREVVTTEEQWNSILSKKKSGDALLLRIRREGDGQSQDSIVTIKIP